MVWQSGRLVARELLSDGRCVRIEASEEAPSGGGGSLLICISKEEKAEAWGRTGNDGLKGSVMLHS